MGSDTDSEICELNAMDDSLETNQIEETTWAEKFLDYFYPLPDITEETSITYPTRPNRYSAMGWNRNHQECYKDDDVKLMEGIQSAYNSVVEKNEENYFKLKEETSWYDFWKCTKPVHEKMLPKISKDSFTLPNRDAKDVVTFPLWNLGDNMARHIANWQGERIKNQDINLMNDPVMLIFDELKNWFFNVLSTKECKKDDLLEINKRQSYITELLHLIPNFGPDRLRLLEIQDSLEEANRIILNSMANKQLPQLLPKVITAGKSLETSVGTYLHFLLGNQEVADNFLSNYIENPSKNCKKLSPVCKVFASANREISTDNKLLSPYQKLSKFFTLNPIAEQNGVLQIKMDLKKECLDDIHFADFVKEEDKKNYLEAIVTLEALMNVRKTLENFRDIQTSLGSYIFAFNFLKIANSLAENYVKLVDKAQLLIQDLHRTARNGLKQLISLPENNQNTHFERNLRALDTKIAEGTSVNAQLQNHCEDAKRSMLEYQEAMKKLAVNLESGVAAKEVGDGMKDLFSQIQKINIFLPALLDKKDLLITEDQPLTTHCINSHTESEKKVSKHDQTKPYRLEQNHLPTSSTYVEHESSYEQIPVTPQFDYAKWDDTIKRDPFTQKPIFTYRVYKHEKEIGSLEFYGQPLLCFSKDKRQHNIVQQTGIFSAIPIPKDMPVNEICKILPPTLFDRVLYSAGKGALHGFLRGATNIVGLTLQARGVSKRLSGYISRFSYYGSLFTIKLGNYLRQVSDAQMEDFLNAACLAAYDTGRVIITNFGLTTLINLLDKASEYFKHHQWQLLSSTTNICSSLVRHGIFISDAVENGLAVTTSAVLAGAVTEAATEKLGSCLLK